MKVIEQTEYRLRLREQPLFFWLGGGVLCLCSVFLLSTLPFAKIECQRQTLPYECVATTPFFVIQRRVKIPLSVLRQAKLEDYIDSEGDRMYSIVLEAGADSIPLGMHSSDGDSRAAIVQQINQFLSNPNQMQLSTNVDNPWLIQMVVGVIFLVGVMGVSLIVFAPALTLDLNRSSGTFTIYHGYFFPRTKQELRLQDIKEVAIEELVDSNGDRFYRVVMHLTSGETVPLRQYYSSGYDSKKKLANLLRQFLYLPPL
ncbi:hypothetical protein FFX45_06440 [Thermosynechococcus sp. CL-1]|nr:hypothetical protein FFX45_06440 [Thermosynechococcus sp. CL-1]